MPRNPDFYDILGVNPASPQEVIEAAYRALMRKYHPDRRAGDPNAVDRACELNEAYDTLGDPERRREYDARRQHPQSPVPYVSPNADPRTAMEPPRLKRCIDCAEQIQPGARVCRYCGARQDGGEKSHSQNTNIHTHVYPSAPPPLLAPVPPARRSNTGCIIAMLLVLILVIIGLGASASPESQGTNDLEESASDFAATLDTPTGDPSTERSAPDQAPEPTRSPVVGEDSDQETTEDVDPGICSAAELEEGSWFRGLDGQIVVFVNGTCRKATARELADIVNDEAHTNGE